MGIDKMRNLGEGSSIYLKIRVFQNKLFVGKHWFQEPHLEDGLISEEGEEKEKGGKMIAHRKEA